MGGQPSCLWWLGLSLATFSGASSSLVYEDGMVYKYSYFAGSWSAHNQNRSTESRREGGANKFHDTKLSATLSVASIGRDVVAAPGTPKVIDAYVLALKIINPVYEQRDSHGHSQALDLKVSVCCVHLSAQPSTCNTTRPTFHVAGHE